MGFAVALGAQQMDGRESVRMTPHQGEIYEVNGIDERLRPVVVVSREELNRGYYVVCVPFTTKRLETRRNLENYVEFQAGEFGLTRNCVAQSELITVIEKTELDLSAGPRGTIQGKKLERLIKAIGYTLSANCRPA